MAVSDNQTNIWQDRNNQHILAELCNALYERELKRLSTADNLELDVLQKRLSSLPYYIQRAAEHISNLFTPLDLDSQNGSWISSQAAKPFSTKADPDKTTEFYQKAHEMALVVPISVSHYGIEQVVLDTIDEVDIEQQRLHCNQHGWFYFFGEEYEANALYQKLLLKPGKPVMTAACCGHQWLNLHKTTPRLLSLREMLLASQINWRKFSQRLPLKK